MPRSPKFPNEVATVDYVMPGLGEGFSVIVFTNGIAQTHYLSSLYVEYEDWP